jgi:hypothetical protein
MNPLSEQTIPDRYEITRVAVDAIRPKLKLAYCCAYVAFVSRAIASGYTIAIGRRWCTRRVGNGIALHELLEIASIVYGFKNGTEARASSL